MKIQILLSVLLLVACASPSSKDWKQLHQHEQTFYSNAKEKAIDEKEANELITAYNTFLTTYPDYEENPEIMLRLADVYLGLNKWFMAVEVFNNFEKFYPEHKKTAFASFSKGLACELAFHHSGYSKHKEYSIAFYQKFLEKHPEHMLSESAKASIEGLK